MNTWTAPLPHFNDAKMAAVLLIPAFIIASSLLSEIVGPLDSYQQIQTMHRRGIISHFRMLFINNL